MKPPSDRFLLQARALALLGLTACSTTPATELGTPGRLHASYTAGWKFKESTWSPGNQETFLTSADFDLQFGARPIWVVGKVLAGSGDPPDYVVDPNADTSGSSELCLGLRHYRSLGRAEPFVSAGLVWLNPTVIGYREASADAYTIDEDHALGGWVDLGLRLPIAESVSIGIAAHQSFGPDVNLAGRDVAPGGTSLLFTAGYRR